MSVYDSTTKLASDIKESKEYKDFKKNMKIIKSENTVFTAQATNMLQCARDKCSAKTLRI